MLVNRLLLLLVPGNSARNLDYIFKQLSSFLACSKLISPPVSQVESCLITLLTSRHEPEVIIPAFRLLNRIQVVSRPLADEAFRFVMANRDSDLVEACLRYLNIVQASEPEEFVLTDKDIDILLGLLDIGSFRTASLAVELLLNACHSVKKYAFPLVARIADFIDDTPIGQFVFGSLISVFVERDYCASLFFLFMEKQGEIERLAADSDGKIADLARMICESCTSLNYEVHQSD
jgi:hypothetical protein